jgi:hypothetical protein
MLVAQKLFVYIFGFSCSPNVSALLHQRDVFLNVHHSISVYRNQRDALFIQFIENQRPLHVSSITCSSSGGASKTAFGILRAYNVSWLWHGCSFIATGFPGHPMFRHYYTNLMFCWPCTTVYQHTETNVMHFSFSLLRIKGLYMFRALLAHPQEALHEQRLVYCMRVMSRLQWNCNRTKVNWHYTHPVYQVPFV